MLSISIDVVTDDEDDSDEDEDSSVDFEWGHIYFSAADGTFSSQSLGDKGLIPVLPTVSSLVESLTEIRESKRNEYHFEGIGSSFSFFVQLDTDDRVNFIAPKKPTIVLSTSVPAYAQALYSLCERLSKLSESMEWAQLSAQIQALHPEVS